jgi:hypothetical protein
LIFDLSNLDILAIFFDILIIAAPKALLRYFPDPNIPINRTEFKKVYDKNIEKIDAFNLSELSKRFDKAVEHKNLENNAEEEDQDKIYFEHLNTHQIFFNELNEYNIKIFGHKHVLELYNNVKKYENHFNFFYYLSIILAIIFTVFIIILNFEVFYLYILILFPIAESIKNLYNLQQVQIHIGDYTVSIEEDVTRASIFSNEHGDT